MDDDLRARALRCLCLRDAIELHAKNTQLFLVEVVRLLESVAHGAAATPQLCGAEHPTGGARCRETAGHRGHHIDLRENVPVVWRDSDPSAYLSSSRPEPCGVTHPRTGLPCSRTDPLHDGRHCATHEGFPFDSWDDPLDPRPQSTAPPSRRNDVHLDNLAEHYGCPDPAECDCECRACKRVWFAAGRPKPAKTRCAYDLGGLRCVLPLGHPGMHEAHVENVVPPDKHERLEKLTVGLNAEAAAERGVHGTGKDGAAMATIAELGQMRRDRDAAIEEARKR